MLSLPILTFHSLDDQKHVISFSPGVFRRGIGKLHENGYRTLGLAQAVINLRETRSVPDKTFVITFDDGYQSVYSEAFPLLREYGMSATVFLTVGRNTSAKAQVRMPSLSGRAMLSWGEVREMADSGFVFGAHTLTHADLTRLPVDQMETEIVRSKMIIEDYLGSAVDSFAYPYGRYNSRCYAIARQCFACACSDELALTTAHSDLYALERVDAYYLRTDRRFKIMRSKWFPWYIGARSVPRRLRRAAQFRTP